MEPIWNKFLTTAQTMNWSMSDPSRGVTFQLPQFHMLESRMWRNFSPKRNDYVDAAFTRTVNGLKPAPEVLADLIELTLKGNAENGYCRIHHYELARHVYTKETAVFWDHVLERIESDDRADWEMPSDFSQKAKVIEDVFYATPLSEMAPHPESGSAAMMTALSRLQTLLKQLPAK